ncbi:hypothetical protein PV08_04331 [Exophiala spinifera]|uniref:Xylanolytic transcriptional activator regulatory domain-containing protein n=1 Tax=Exophiala spinifera TaxID=91928 RepID=A0A0D2BEU6_9EURO|nr:uncharacterized protein PV08_04331 [Exophiala spinifera]KIW17140.1 hypothetical protein PV08_04331 [Exophiala spinifera]
MPQCDAQSPSCSVCVAAGVPCVSLDTATNATAPRSIARYLEGRIADLERVRDSYSLPGIGSGHLSGGRVLPSCDTGRLSPIMLWDTAVNHTLHDITPSFLGLTEAIRLPGCSAAPTQIPSAKKSFGLNDLDETNPRSILNQHPSNLPLTSVPTRVAEFLFDIYISRIIQQYPIYHSSDAIKAFDAVFRRQALEVPSDSRPGARDLYMVSLIMAISLSTAARNKQARAQSLGTGLFRNAMLYVPVVLSNDLSGLQALLLLIQYTFLNPNVANLWLLTGMSSEACIDLGLHRELPESIDIDVLERDMRRRIFWCAWEMEVAVSAPLNRPIRTQNKYISAEFPAEYVDFGITRNGIDVNVPRAKFVSRRIWLFRKVESSIMSILYQNEPLPSDCPSLESWMAETEHEIMCWREEVHHKASLNQDSSVKSQWDELELYADIAYNYIIVLLFRSCPRIRVPSRQHLMKAFAASKEVATGYWRQANTEFGYMKYVFHPCHHTFLSAIVFLQALQYCRPDIADAYEIEEVEEFMDRFSRFFSTISERWPAATQCLQEYERLLGPIKQDYLDFLLLRNQSTSEIDLLQNAPMDEYLDGTAHFRDPFEIWPVTNPLLSSNGNDTFDAYSYLPYDWNAEFGFGMDLALSNQET